MNREAFIKCLNAVDVARGAGAGFAVYNFAAGTVYTYSGEMLAYSGHPASEYLSCAVDAGTLREFLAKCKGDDLDINFNAETKELELKCGRSKCGLKTEEPVPIPDDIDFTAEQVAIAPDVQEALKIAASNVYSGTNKPMYRCVMIDPKRVGSSDMISVYIHYADTPVTEDVLIDGDSLARLCKVGFTSLAETPNWIIVCTPDATCAVRRSPGKFAELEKFLQESDKKIALPVEMAGMVQKALLFAEDKGVRSPVTVTVKKNILTVRCEGDKGWFEEEVRTKSSADITFCAYPAPLLAVLNKMKECMVCENTIRFDSEDGGTVYYMVCLVQATKGK